MSKKMKRNPYFKNNIRLLRLQYDMSQEEFAIALGMEPGKSTNLSAKISGWERGEREPSLEGLSDICRRFGVTADWLLGLEDSAKSDFGRKASLLLLRNEKNITEEDKSKLLLILEAFAGPMPKDSVEDQ